MKESATERKFKIKEGIEVTGITSEETYAINNEDKIDKGKLQSESAYSAQTNKQSSPLKEITNEVDITSFLKNPVLIKNNELKNDFLFPFEERREENTIKIQRKTVGRMQNFHKIKKTKSILILSL